MCCQITECSQESIEGVAMERTEDLTARCMELLTINRALFDEGYPEAAYHALEAALYCAEYQGDPAMMHMVETVAAEEFRRLKRVAHFAGVASSSNVNAPASLTESGRWANLENLYGIAVRQANLKASNPDLRAAPSRHLKSVEQ
jgi:hypothetical protein